MLDTNTLGFVDILAQTIKCSSTHYYGHYHATNEAAAPLLVHRPLPPVIDHRRWCSGVLPTTCAAVSPIVYRRVLPLCCRSSTQLHPFVLVPLLTLLPSPLPATAFPSPMRPPRSMRTQRHSPNNLRGCACCCLAAHGTAAPTQLPLTSPLSAGAAARPPTPTLLVAAHPLPLCPPRSIWAQRRALSDLRGCP